ncbi:probable dimethyladenosine transferase [Phtheirospermum japonicum]|uniref:rRNA adenine N(6)-methyltransferase n=1 Tax=Phtheirospermum japonicum TaxID=374723 RepID=A0A830CC99_9LAMI|nr:probable dimethyladenosine transferase [Phtheirospermum japonicum]
MPHRRKALSEILCNPSFRRQSFQRCLRTKSGHGFGEVCHNNKAEDDEEEEGKVRLFKSRGQHLLTNPRVLDSIVRASNIKPDDTVLEIGPGTGNLTLKLLEAAKNVVAIEIDGRMVEALRKRAAGRGFEDRLNIVNGDALRTEFPKFNLVVANIPYGISSPLLAKLVYGANENPFRSATLLLQKEFARRLLAKPGDSEFNRLAVNVKIYPKSEIPDVDLNEWWAFTRTCFSKKNKTLGATLKQKRKLMELMKLSKFERLSENGNFESDNGISVLKGKIVSTLESGGFLDKRPSKLSNDELLRLLSLFNEAGIYFHDQAEPKGTCDAAYAASDDLM